MDKNIIYEDLIAGTPPSVCQHKATRCWMGIVMVILASIILLMLVEIFCLYCSNKLSECSLVCLLILTIPTSFICVTYIISLLIKRLPDKDKSEERQYRFAQFYLSKIQTEIPDYNHKYG